MARVAPLFTAVLFAVRQDWPPCTQGPPWDPTSIRVQVELWGLLARSHKALEANCSPSVCFGFQSFALLALNNPNWDSLYTVSPPYPQVPNPQSQPTAGRKCSEKKNPESSKKRNLNLPHAGNYLHSIYLVFTTVYIVLTLY